MTVDRFSTSQSQSLKDQEALPIENGLLTASYGTPGGQYNWDQPPGLSDDMNSSGPEESVTPKSVRSVIGSPRGFNNLLPEDVDAEGEPDLDRQGHAKTETQHKDSMEDYQQDVNPTTGGALDFPSAPVSFMQQEGNLFNLHFPLL